MSKMKNKENFFLASLWASGMLILVLFAIIWYRVVAFDTEETVVNSTDTNSSVLFTVPGDDVIQDSWETSIQESDSRYDHSTYTGRTIGCNLENTNSYIIKDWVLRLDIKDNCYLNGFWCGSIELHQFRDDKEIITLLQNQLDDYTKYDVDYNKYSDVMLLHLKPGDYLIYYPSSEANEDIVNPDSTVGIGFIFYYQNHLDLSNWTLTYGNNMKMTDLLMFKVGMAILILWLIALIWCFILVNMRNRLRKEMNAQIKNFSIMADLYLEAYIIDIDKNTSQLIKGNDSSSALKLSEDKVQETLNNKVQTECIEIFREELLEFLNLSTVFTRMNGSSSISYEYLDNDFGWCELRFFVISNEENNHKIVLTLQDINEQKKKFNLIEERVSLAEFKQSVSGSFMETVSFALKDITAKINILGNTIISDSDQENIKDIAHTILMNTRHLYLIQNMALDLFEIENQKLKLNLEEYNIADVASELKNILEPFAASKNCEIKLDIDSKIPSKLLGDYSRIEQILVILMFSSVLMSDNGYVKLSVYGKRSSDEEELLISVRDTTMGFTDKHLQEIREFMNGGNIENYGNASLIYFRIINGILNYMGSELKIVSVLNEGSEFYFALKQKVIEE